jgi:hypothetical protein
VKLGSPATDVVVEDGYLLVLESGILDPNDEARGRLERYAVVGNDSLRFDRVVIDSFSGRFCVAQYDFAKDGAPQFVIGQFGDNRGQLCTRAAGESYQRRTSPSPGAIHVRFASHRRRRDIVRPLRARDQRIGCSRMMVRDSGPASHSRALSACVRLHVFHTDRFQW